MLLDQLVRTSLLVAGTSSRLAKIEHLAELLRQAGPYEIEIEIAYLSGRVRQPKLGVGWATLQKARTAPAGTPSLRILEVDEALSHLASISGKGSAASRTALLHDLFGRSTAEEQDFLVRLVTGELRQGALEGIMVEAVAKAAGLPSADVRRAAMIAADLGAVARSVLGEGAAGLTRYAVQMFRPIRPMLAGTATGVQDALSRLGEAAFEYKLDGARIQVHKSGGDVRVFSRLMNEVTAAVPEVVDLARGLGFADAILDGEAIALDAAGRSLPFQSTMRRFGRKLGVGEWLGELPLTAFFFDLVHADGTSLLHESYQQRYDRLAQRVPEAMRPPRLVTSEAAEAESFLEAAIRTGYEGLMAKDLRSPYQAGTRGAAWLKIKRADTLDLVVLAAEWGHGRRSGWLSNLHLEALDPAGRGLDPSGGFVLLGKTFKGMTDEMLKWQTERLRQLEIRREGIVVFVRPELVVEIAFNGVQASPIYLGGLALRFARVVRYREDKKAEEADTIETVRRIAGLAPPSP